MKYYAETQYVKQMKELFWLGQEPRPPPLLSHPAPAHLSRTPGCVSSARRPETIGSSEGNTATFTFDDFGRASFFSPNYKNNASLL